MTQPSTFSSDSSPSPDREPVEAYFFRDPDSPAETVEILRRGDDTPGYDARLYPPTPNLWEGRRPEDIQAALLEDIQERLRQAGYDSRIERAFDADAVLARNIGEPKGFMEQLGRQAVAFGRSYHRTAEEIGGPVGEIMQELGKIGDFFGGDIMRFSTFCYGFGDLARSIAGSEEGKNPSLSPDQKRITMARTAAGQLALYSSFAHNLLPGKNEQITPARLVSHMQEAIDSGALDDLSRWEKGKTIYSRQMRENLGDRPALGPSASHPAYGTLDWLEKQRFNIGNGFQMAASTLDTVYGLGQIHYEFGDFTPERKAEIAGMTGGSKAWAVAQQYSALYYGSTTLLGFLLLQLPEKKPRLDENGKALPPENWVDALLQKPSSLVSPMLLLNDSSLYVDGFRLLRGGTPQERTSGMAMLVSAVSYTIGDIALQFQKQNRQADFTEDELVMLVSEYMEHLPFILTAEEEKRFVRGVMARVEPQCEGTGIDCCAVENRILETMHTGGGKEERLIAAAAAFTATLPPEAQDAFLDRFLRYASHDPAIHLCPDRLRQNISQRLDSLTAAPSAHTPGEAATALALILPGNAQRHARNLSNMAAASLSPAGSWQEQISQREQQGLSL